MSTPPRRSVRARLVLAFGSSAFTTAQAREVGVSPDDLSKAARRGEIARLRRGVYTCDAFEAMRELVLSAVSDLAARGIPCALGGLDCAHIWDIPVDRELSAPKPVLLVPRDVDTHGVQRFGVLLRPSELPDDHVTIGPGGLPVVTPLRAGIEAARAVRGRTEWAAIAVVAGQRRHLEWESGEKIDIAAVMQDPEARREISRRTIEAIDALRGHGVVTARRVAQATDPRLETPLEVVSWLRFRRARLVVCEPQVWKYGASGRRYRVDFDLGDGIVGEADGAVKYDDRSVLLQEKERQEDLEAAGSSVLRWGWRLAWSEPQELLRRLRQARHRRRRAS